MTKKEIQALESRQDEVDLYLVGRCASERKHWKIRIRCRRIKDRVSIYMDIQDLSKESIVRVCIFDQKNDNPSELEFYGPNSFVRVMHEAAITEKDYRRVGALGFDCTLDDVLLLATPKTKGVAICLYLFKKKKVRFAKRWILFDREEVKEAFSKVNQLYEDAIEINNWNEKQRERAKRQLERNAR
jgi:hypothetical protein